LIYCWSFLKGAFTTDQHFLRRASDFFVSSRFAKAKIISFMFALGFRIPKPILLQYEATIDSNPWVDRGLGDPLSRAARIGALLEFFWLVSPIRFNGAWTGGNGSGRPDLDLAARASLS
jgi:hypothetical protein